MAAHQYRKIENILTVDANEPFGKVDILSPERTVVKYNNRRIHIYKACYLKRLQGSSQKERCVVPSSLCKKRAELVGKLIRKAPLISVSTFNHFTQVFDWLDNNQKADKIFLENDALETNRIYSEQLFSESRASIINGNARSKHVLKRLQAAMRIVISSASGIPDEALKNSAVLIYTTASYENSQKRTTDKKITVNFWLFNKRYFESIANFLIGQSKIPLVIPRDDLGYPDYKQWTRMTDSNLLEKSRAEGKPLAAFFDDHDQFISDNEVVKARCRNLKIRYNRQRYEVFKSKINDPEYLITDFFRRVSMHFAHLLLMASGCNMEQLQNIDFSKDLKNTPDAKRLVAVKPRANYSPKPVQFSSKFLPIWRAYLKIRNMIIEKYSPGFGSYGIPIPILREEFREDGGVVLWQADSNLIRIRSNKSFGFPEDLDIPLSKSARDFKTINFLDLTGGDIGLTSKIIGRSPKVTRKNYSFKGFEDSAKELTDFFNELTQSATIKAEGYSPKAPIKTNGYPIRTGLCDSENEAPKKIQGVTEVAPEPRCGAPVTCFFCVHYGHHANLADIKLILSAKAWIKKQTKAVSRNIDEHIIKFLPILERIDDIIESFRGLSEDNENTYQKALIQINAGNYSAYWRNKIDALIAALEV